MINNLETMLYMLILLAIVFLTNTVLGIVIANKKTEFNIKKLISGISKGIIITLCMLSFCITLEMIPEVLSRINIEVPNDLITVVEIVMMTLTAYKKYALDCVNKFKIILGIESGE